MELNQPETMYLGYEKGKVLYLREGFFKQIVRINPSHKEYQRLVGFLGEDYAVSFSKMDVEYQYLYNLYKGLLEGGV